MERDKIFRFKHFAVHNEKSAMKVNTDGVMLGAATKLPAEEWTHPMQISTHGYKVLDAGTGTGVIALMLAQRLAKITDDFTITGIDIDPASAEEASGNFSASPWAAHLVARCIDFSECKGKYDLIVSNPPYFNGDLANPDQRKKTARHTTALSGHTKEMSYRNLLDFAAGHLTPGGRISMILPAATEKDAVQYAESIRLFPADILWICSNGKNLPYRAIVQFTKKLGHPAVPTEECPLLTNTNTIKYKNEDNYTKEYLSLIKDFYPWA